MSFWQGVKDVTSTLNPFDDSNGAFQGSGGRTPVTPADPGQDLSGQYWSQYGQGAQDQLQKEREQTQANLNNVAGASALSGQVTNQNLNSVGNAAANTAATNAAQINATGAQYGNQMVGMGSQYAGQQAQLGQQAAGYGQLAASDLSGMGANISGQGQALNNQASGALGRDISGSQQSALATLEANRGPSAAQAQLAEATNANQANALAMARSGRGFGGNASAMSQAADLRAKAQQGAANQSAMLTAQEDAAWRQRQAQNLAASGQLATQEGSLNQQREAGLYGLGLGAQQSGANIAAQGYNFGQQGIAQNQAGLNAAAGTYMGALNSGAATELGAQANAAGIQAQGLGLQSQNMAAGGQLEQAGYGQAGNIYANAGNYGINNTNAQSSLVGQQYGLAQQNQQNVLQANAINNGLAIQQQNQGNQMMGAAIGAIGSAVPMIASAVSDRNAKEGIEPTNVTLSEPDQAKIVTPVEGTAEQISYDPYSLGTGISGPNQAQGEASRNAADAASAQQSTIRDQEQHNRALSESKKSAQDILNGGHGMGGTMLTPMGAFGNAIKAGAQNATGDPSVNPITGQSWFQSSGGGGYQPYQQPAMLPVTSDKREKEAMRAFDATPGYSYNYKDPEAMGATHGRQFGLMAQDLEKTPAGKSVVKQAPDGTKMVDTSRLALVEGAALNGALKRIAELEKRLGSGSGKGKAA